MPAVFANNASTTLASAITNSVTSITVATGTGALFPALSGANYFYATLVDVSNNIEIVKVTARSSDTMTVVRGQEGTTARSYIVGSKFELRVTAAGMANKVAYDDTGFTVAESQVTGLVAALAALTANQLPSGTTTVFYQAAAPTGWTQDTSQNDITLRVVSGAGGAAFTTGQAFSTAVASGSISAHALTQAEMPIYDLPITDPGHAHVMGNGIGYASGGTLGLIPYTGGATLTAPSGTGIVVHSGGSGYAHTHTFAGNNFWLNFMNVILCRKN